jgi:hypothetical protein
MPGLFDDHIPKEEKIGEIKREIEMRRTVYARRIGEGKMNRDTARRKVAIMRAILADYEEGRVSCP